MGVSLIMGGHGGVLDNGLTMLILCDIKECRMCQDKNFPNKYI